ncbi:hypothetical protein NSTC745_02902 [Nostoc sp. DSM 114161]|jgi:hypothetical protein
MKQQKFCETASGVNKAFIAKPEINLGSIFDLECGNIAL